MSPHRKYYGLGWLMSKIKFHCHCNISDYTKFLNIFNFSLRCSCMYIFPIANMQ